MNTDDILKMIASSVEKIKGKKPFDPAQPTDFDAIEQFDEAIVRYLCTYLLLLPTMSTHEGVESASKKLATIAMDTLPFDIICVLTQPRDLSLFEIMQTPDFKYATLYRLICPAVTRQLVRHKSLPLHDSFISATMFANAFMWNKLKMLDDCFVQVTSWVQEWIAYKIDLRLIEDYAVEMLRYKEWQVHGGMVLYYVNQARTLAYSPLKMILETNHERVLGAPEPTSPTSERPYTPPACDMISDTIVLLTKRHAKLAAGTALKLLSLLLPERGDQVSPLRFAYLQWRVSSAVAEDRRRFDARCAQLFRRSALILQRNPLARAWQLLC